MILRFTEGPVIQTTERKDSEADLSIRNQAEVRNGVQRFHISTYYTWDQCLAQAVQYFGYQGHLRTCEHYENMMLL